MESERVGSSLCQDFVRQVFAKCGLTEELASRWADLLVETSLMGIDSHGIRMLDRYVRHIQGGGISINFDPITLRDRTAIAVIDAQGGAGHLAASHAMELAVRKARAAGVGMVSVIGTNHAGACALYVAQAARTGCVGICTAVSRPGIAPWGGKQPLIGLNPLAVGFPVAGKPPFLLDLSTTVTAMGKITQAADLGRGIPEGWALDRAGNPTTDPDQAREGSLLPIGGYKGCGLAMAIEAVTALLPGGGLAVEVLSWISQTARPMNASFAAIALDIAAFTETSQFEEKAAAWTETITGSPRREGVEELRYPGQRKALIKKERTQSGIPLDRHTRSMLDGLAGEFALQPLTAR